jgi:hypothetical protein
MLMPIEHPTCSRRGQDGGSGGGEFDLDASHFLVSSTCCANRKRRRRIGKFVSG